MKLTELRDEIRARDNYTCQDCGRTEKQTGKILHVHHIDYNRNHNTKQNLISLCSSCHWGMHKGARTYPSYGSVLKQHNYADSYIITKKAIQELETSKQNKEILNQKFLKQKSYTKIAKEFNLSRERVRQICERNFNRIKDIIRYGWFMTFVKSLNLPEFEKRGIPQHLRSTELYLEHLQRENML